MVDLFNKIDEASRSDLERLNEANAARFEARLDQRTGELGARIAVVESTVARLDKQVSDFPAVLKRALHTQTRWMIGAWGILLASQTALWLR